MSVLTAIIIQQGNDGTIRCQAALLCWLLLLQAGAAARRVPHKHWPTRSNSTELHSSSQCLDNTQVRTALMSR